MKKLVLSISMFLIAATTFAQSEVVTDSIPPISLDGYKNFNGFMLDMGSMIVAPPPLIAPQLYYQPYNNNTIANYNEIFRPNMNIIYDRGSYNHVFTPMYLGMGIYGFGTMSMPPTLQSATFKLKNGLHITTYGGAILMNAGAHGKEMKDIVTEITAIDYNGKIHKFTNEQAKFTYRNSIFSSGKYIILQAKIILEKGNAKEIKAKMDEYAQFRKEKQPIEYPSAGSTFKRGTDFITAKLIDDAGLKGYTIGGAKVSEKHAGFIINTGNATAQDVLDLAKYVTNKVYEKFGKKIEFEIKIVQ